MKRNLILSTALLSAAFFITSCSEGVKKDPKPIDIQELAKDQPETHGAEIKEGEITLSTPLDKAMVDAGKATYGLN